VSIVLIQPNFDARKYVLEDNIRELRALTDAAVASLPEKPDMVVWPEGEFEVDMRWWTAAENADSYWGRVAADLFAYQRKLGSSILTGTLDHEMVAGTDGGEERVNYNSAVLVGPDGRLSDFYHKMHLVPFSEYFPLDREKFSALYKLFESYEISHWGVGRNRLVFQHGKMRFAAPICFEDVFPDHVRRFVLRDADIIMNLGNDYWSLSPVEGIQHGIFAIFRAVENRRPVLRCTASGYTVYADAAGWIQPGSPAPYTPGFLAARVPLPEKTLTLYTRWGDWFPLVCGVVTAAFFAVRLLTWRRRRGG
jgi:apolipoprotein N-acyltransferase